MKVYSGEMLEAAKNAAIIEAREECGIEVQKENIEFFHLSHCGATIEWDLYYFIIREFKQNGMQDLGEDEFITFDWYTQEQIIDHVST